MNSAGISAESLRTRDSAGCSRICIESKSSTPSRAITISPSSAECGGKQVAERAQLGEVAQQRPLVPRPERELAAVVLEHAAEAVPFRLELPAVRTQAAPSRAVPPWAGRARLVRAPRGTLLAWASSTASGRSSASPARSRRYSACVKRITASRGTTEFPHRAGHAVRGARPRAALPARSGSSSTSSSGENGAYLGRATLLGREFGQFMIEEAGHSGSTQGAADQAHRRSARDGAERRCACSTG